MAVTLGQPTDGPAPPRGARTRRRWEGSPYSSLMLGSPVLDRSMPGAAMGGARDDPLPRRAPHPGRRRRARRASRGRRSPTPSTTPTCCAPTPSRGCRRRSRELGYSPNRAARNLRTRASHLIGLRFQPGAGGHANAAMDRFVHSLVETAGGAGYHILLFAGRRGRGPPARVRRPAALDGRRRLHRHRHLPRQPAGGLAAAAAGAVRRVRPAVGRRRRRPPLGRRRRRRRRRPRHQPPARRAATSAIAWIGWRKDSRIGEDRRSGWTRAMHGRAPLHHRPGLPRRGHRRVAAARRAAVLLDEASPTAFVCASDTLAMGVLHTLRDRGLTPGPGHRGRRLRRLPGRPGRPARPHLGAPAARGGRRRDRPRPRGSARPPARRQPGRAAHPDAGGPRDGLRGVRRSPAHRGSRHCQAPMAETERCLGSEVPRSRRPQMPGSVVA